MEISKLSNRVDENKDKKNSRITKLASLYSRYRTRIKETKDEEIKKYART